MPRFFHRLLFALIALAALLSACGQKGPLYLPRDYPTPPARGAAGAPPPATPQH